MNSTLDWVDFYDDDNGRRFTGKFCFKNKICFLMFWARLDCSYDDDDDDDGFILSLEENTMAYWPRL